ncbi:hypothetical protein GJ496_001937 [Pomphorhynchus laevis]|nr:hypothetical protein GJ496_001937 [Pomphorhynchus laevis]
MSKLQQGLNSIISRYFKSVTQSAFVSSSTELKSAEQSHKPTKKVLETLDALEIDKWDALPEIEKFSIAMKLKGYNHPLGAGKYKRKLVSTKDDPNIIASFRDKRPIGCVCEEDDCHIKWMMIHKNETKRCFCGHYFKLIDAKFPDLSEFGIDSSVMAERIRNM